MNNYEIGFGIAAALFVFLVGFRFGRRRGLKKGKAERISIETNYWERYRAMRDEAARLTAEKLAAAKAEAVAMLERERERCQKFTAQSLEAIAYQNRVNIDKGKLFPPPCNRCGVTSPTSANFCRVCGLAFRLQDVLSAMEFPQRNWRIGQMEDALRPLIQERRARGISLLSIAKELNKAGYHPYEGHKWGMQEVKTVLGKTRVPAKSMK